MSATGIVFADGGPSDNVVIGTYEVEAFALASQGMQQQAPAAHARGGAMMRPYVPDPVHWDDGKRCLLVTSPTGVSPAAKKVTRWSSAEDALFADLVKDDVGGDEESPEESEGAAGSHAALFDLSGSPYTRLRRSAPEPLRRQYSDDGEGSLEPSEREGRKDVPMWTVEEDLLILKLVETHGKKWSKIAAHLPGRTDNGVRNRWNRMEKAQTLRTKHGAEHGYRCRRCGQPKRGHICAALTSGDQPEGDNLTQKAAELSALSAKKMQQVLDEKAQAAKDNRRPSQSRQQRSSSSSSGGPTRGTAPPLRHSKSGASGPPPPSKAGAKPPRAAPKGPTYRGSAGHLTVETGAQEPLASMDESQLDAFLTELHLSLAMPTTPNGVGHPLKPAPGVQHPVQLGLAPSMGAAGMGAGGLSIPPPAPLATRPMLPTCSSVPAAGYAAAGPSAEPSAGPSAAGPRPYAAGPYYPAGPYYAAGPYAAGPYALGGPPGASFELPARHTSQELESILLSGAAVGRLPPVTPQPSTDTLLAQAMPSVSIGATRDAA